MPRLLLSSPIARQPYRYVRLKFFNNLCPEQRQSNSNLNRKENGNRIHLSITLKHHDHRGRNLVPIASEAHYNQCTEDFLPLPSWRTSYSRAEKWKRQAALVLCSALAQKADHISEWVGWFGSANDRVWSSLTLSKDWVRNCLLNMQELVPTKPPVLFHRRLRTRDLSFMKCSALSATTPFWTMWLQW